MQHMVKIAVLTNVPPGEMSYFGKTSEFFSNCGVPLLTENRVFRTHMVPLDRGNSGDHGDTQVQKVIGIP
jgi:hypothetical protein